MSELSDGRLTASIVRRYINRDPADSGFFIIIKDIPDYDSEQQQEEPEISITIGVGGRIAAFHNIIDDDDKQYPYNIDDHHHHRHRTILPGTGPIRRIPIQSPIPSPYDLIYSRSIAIGNITIIRNDMYAARLMMIEGSIELAAEIIRDTDSVFEMTHSVSIASSRHYFPYAIRTCTSHALFVALPRITENLPFEPDPMLELAEHLRDIGKVAFAGVDRCNTNVYVFPPCAYSRYLIRSYFSHNELNVLDPDFMVVLFVKRIPRKRQLYLEQPQRSPGLQVY